MSARELITEHLDLWTGAVTQKSISGRGSNGKVELTGIKKLRELILELALKGKLSERFDSDYPANQLVEKFTYYKRNLIREGHLRKQIKLPEMEDRELAYEIPETWAFERLANISLQITKGTTPTSIGLGFTNIGIRFVKVETLSNGQIDHKNSQFISDETHKTLLRSQLQAGDILFSIAGTIGKTAIVQAKDTPANTNQALAIIKGTSAVFSEHFLKLQLDSFVSAKAKDKARGGAMSNISLGDLSNLIVLVPPLEEQHRIVQKVDELMALCDRLEQQTSDRLKAHETLVDTLLETLTNSQNADELADNWARLSAHFDTLFTTEQCIDKLKQAILQLAVMGRLVEQDATDEPAKEYLERIKQNKSRLADQLKQRKAKPLPPIQEAERPFPLPRGWALTRLDDITNIQSGIAKGKKLTGKKTRVLPYLRVANVQRSALNLAEIKEIEIDEDDVPRYMLENRDLLITEGGDWDKVGRTAIWDASVSPIIHQNHVFRARLVLPEQNENWLEKYLNSQFARDYFADSSKQTTNLASINKTQLRSCVIPLPPHAEQARIVQKVDELMVLCDQLRKRLELACEIRRQMAEAIVDQAVH